MTTNLKVLQVIPKLGYGGAETGCYDIAHYLPENNCESFIVTSGGELTKFVDKKKVRIITLPVHSKNPLLIFVNFIALIGNEEQKNGIYQADLNEFYNSCVNELGLDIIGLMCLPPKEDGSKKYFLKMKNLAKNLDIQELSMGMSNDYLDAANNGSTFLRIGTKIFGKRS